MSDQGANSYGADLSARLQQARDLWARGEADQAIDMLRALHAQAPGMAAHDLAGALLGRGRVREGTQSLYGAIADYEEALRVAPPGPQREEAASSHAALSARLRANIPTEQMVPPAPPVVQGGTGRKRGPGLWIGLALLALVAVGALLAALVLPGLGERRLEGLITPREATRNAQLARTPTAARTAVSARTPTSQRTPTRAGVFRTPTSPPSANQPGLPSGYTIFESQIYPYTIGYPEEWDVQGEFEFEDITVDTFIGDDGVNVNVLADEELKGLGVETLMRSIIRGNENEGATDVERIGEMQIDGRRALLVRWTDSTDNSGFAQAVWVSSTHGWVATMYVEDGDVERNLDLFKVMLGTLTHRLR